MRALRDDGTEVKRGECITSGGRGDAWIYLGPDSLTVPGKSGKVIVRNPNNPEDTRVLYAHIFGLKVLP